MSVTSLNQALGASFFIYFMLSQAQTFIRELAEWWHGLGQWNDPADEHACIDFIVEEAAESLSKIVRLQNTQYTRNNPQQITIEMVDEEVADTLIMCLRYFNLRQINAGHVMALKLRLMTLKRLDQCPGAEDRFYNIFTHSQEGDFSDG
jgi:NTP pyrophosphatase (non-canonical NTP hydrolase)